LEDRWKLNQLDQESLNGLIVVVVFPRGKLAYTGEFIFQLGGFMD
jgi:hypothetical protein